MANPIPADDRRSLTLRLSVMQYVLAATFAALAVGFWYYQIARYAQFREIADNQYMQRVPLPAPRGLLFDRNGAVLVQNQEIRHIVVHRERVNDMDRTLQELAAATGVDLAGLRETVERRRRDPPFRPIILIENITDGQLAAFKARSLELPGVDVLPVPTRRYSGTLAAHVFGYVGQVSEAQLQREEFKELPPGAIIGQSGLEQAYNNLLMGVEGMKRMIVNSRGRELRDLGMDVPDVGTPLQLTIDADLQRAAEDGFRHFGIVNAKEPYNGAAVILDPRSGEILSLLSLPAYDPNDFALGISRATWNGLQTNKEKPLQNRALQGTYSPGSTFKLVVATAALEEGVATPDFRVNCTGGKFFYTRTFMCHKRGGHGSVDMRRAIEQSCNVYFYTLGQMLGVDRIHKWATALGLGRSNGIDLPNEGTGLMPSSEWKQRVRKEPWYPGETISVAIGQGQVAVTPLSLAVMMMTLANGGTRHTPHVLKAVDRGKGWEPAATLAPQSVTRMKPSTVRAVHDGLWMAVNGAGTAGRARIEGRDVSGKTGTAQPNMSLENQRRLAGRREARDHGWFVFMAPRDNPVIAGAIFAEHAEHGYYGASIAKHIIETYYAKLEGKPLPTLEKPPAGNVIVADAAPASPVRPARPASPRSGGEN
ncbi:MAG: penicillin-binding protein 2 [Acidobacteriota bacterium]|nr:penicillin-binding protein 2 [Acidobacteriota bacterium]